LVRRLLEMSKNSSDFQICVHELHKYLEPLLCFHRFRGSEIKESIDQKPDFFQTIGTNLAPAEFGSGQSKLRTQQVEDDRAANIN
jgi:hypothetical protein